MMKKKNRYLTEILGKVMVLSLIATSITLHSGSDVNAETVHGTGFVMDDRTAAPAKDIVGINELGAVNYPSKVDLSGTNYFPPIQDQYRMNSCTAFATTYYQFTYEANRLNGVKSNGTNRYYSPLCVYNYVNGGMDAGSSVERSYDILKERGALKWSQFPYDNDFKKWSTDTQAMIDALNTRVASTDKWCLDTRRYPVDNIKSSNLYGIKRNLSSEQHVLVVGMETNGEMSNMTIKSATNGQKVICRCSDNPGMGHTMTIVGYDDNICVDVNGNNQIEPAERGAFKVANSWGTGWGNQGYIWVLYDALNLTTKIPGQWESKQKIAGTRRAIFAQDESGSQNIFYSIDVENKYVDVVTKVEATVRYGTNSNITLKRSKSGYMTGQKTMHTSWCKGNEDKTRKMIAVYDNSEFNNDFNELLGKVTWSISMSKANSDYEPTTYMNLKYSLVDSKNRTIASYASSLNGTLTGTYGIMTDMKRGDVDYDFDISLSDVQLIQAYYLQNQTPSNLQEYLADYNQDGRVDLTDSQAVLNAYLR